MGRNAKPVELLLLEQKKHLTKAEIERRKASEIKLQNQNIRADPLVMADERALKEFKSLKKLYREIEFVGTLDSHIINQYCMAVSELDDLVAILSEVRNKMRGGDEVQRELAKKDFLELDTEVRLKRSELVKLSDRLYLNPVSRTKNVPKEQPKPKDPNARMFGDEGTG